MTDTQALPPVAPEVTARLVAGLSPRLRKRLDAATAKLAARPVSRDGDVYRIALDDETTLELRATGGSVTDVDAIHCGCLLAPGCVHRPAAAGAAPVAAEATGPEDQATDDHPAPEPADPRAAPPTEAPDVPAATPQQLAAAAGLWAAGAAALEAGVDGAGAVVQAELLGAAHVARLAGLPRPAAAAVGVVGRLRAARAADPAYRLADLVEELRELLSTAHGLGRASGPRLAELRGLARRPYLPGGSLRLYGLFSEPVLAASGHAGVVTWTADTEGRLFRVPDVAPGGAERAAGAVERTVRLGDAALTHRRLARAGLVVSGATVSPDGRLGAGAAVRAVQAGGAGWHEPPLDRFWAEPPHRQAARALAAAALPEARRPPGSDLLFLDVTCRRPLRATGGHVLLADCAGVPVRLTVADEDPALAHRDNLRLLAAAPGLRLRVVGRLTPGPRPQLRLLAVGRPPGDEGPVLRLPDPAGRVDLGYDRLQRTDLPTSDATAPGPPALADDEAVPAPIHLLRRRADRAVAAGRRALALPGTAADDLPRLRRAGLATGAWLLAELHRAAADRGRDVFGRLLPADADRFARAWLATASYTESVAHALCAAAWAAGAEEAAREDDAAEVTP
ncbi:hypothetical protein [Streptomyces hainanensis]|uniref:SWIM-type domain-containing protein n=1 Tax=Streptomyces hainanensis TaxID=402648 RepID=A0A4R4TC79_9ACTN|nr:hypothetical protein [Streptomyces hainanensis]TDC74890.1 hypothetical protein E1283_14145 [Streptomyces hainanensis]